MSNVKEFSIKNYYTRNVALDDEDADGQMLPLRIRRFSIAQLQAFQRGFERLTHPTSERFIFRKPDGDEQARDDKQAFVVSDAEITRRRESEMDETKAAVYQACKDADDAFMVEFCSKAIAEHVWLPKGFRVIVERDDESQIVVEGGAGSGNAIVEAFGGNLSFLTRITSAIHAENTLTPEAKKRLRSLFASTASSPTPDAETPAVGPTPAATVALVENEGSASNDAALEVQAPIPSGSTLPAA